MPRGGPVRAPLALVGASSPGHEAGVPLPFIDDDFAGGAIEVVRAPRRGPIDLALRGDSAADVRQWFAFRLASPGPRHVRILDAASSTFDGAWHRYRAMVSLDGRSWRRVPTALVDDALVLRHAGHPGPAWYAYFSPWSEGRLEALVAAARAAPHAAAFPVARTVLGRDVPVIALGDADAERTVWVIARQHPGEAPASWAAEGLVRRLLSSRHAATRALLSNARVFVAPLVNVDGAQLGNHRTNAAGADLNRAWDDPDEDAAPEVAGLLEAIEETGVDVFLDLHADESAPFAFPSGCEGNPSWDDEQEERERSLRADLVALSPDFVDEPWYGVDEPGEADLSAAANAIAERFGATSLTLELPFGDDGDGVIRDGWSELRAAELGATLAVVLGRAVARLG